MLLVKYEKNADGSYIKKESNLLFVLCEKKFGLG